MFDTVQSAFDIFHSTAAGGKTITITQLAHIFKEIGYHISQDHAYELASIACGSTTPPTHLTFQQFAVLFHSFHIFKLATVNKLSSEEETTLNPAHVKARLRMAGLEYRDEAVVGMLSDAGGNPSLDFLQFCALWHHQNQLLRTPADVLFFSEWYKNRKMSAAIALRANKRDLTFVEDLLVGTVAGVAICLVGHPFDTVKVRIQTSPQGWFTGGMDCFMQTVRKEGALAVYKGMGGPMMSVPLINAVVFATYGQARAWLQTDPDETLTVPQITMCGAYSGLWASIIVSPIEMVKSRLQLQYSSNVRTLQFQGPWDCVRKVWQRQGIRGIYKGMSATLYREAPGYAGQFGVYEAIRRLLTPEGQTTTTPALLLAGGLSGIGAWLTSYPMDYIKTHLQTESLDMRRSRFKKHPYLFDGGFFDCGRQIVKKHGWGRLWHGFGPCIGRAFPANAAGFFVYEYCAEKVRDFRP